jgi:intracellular multiplication protein IcmC
MSETFADLMQVLVNFGSVIEPIVHMLRAFVGCAGIYVFASGLVEIWGAGNDNSMKFVGGSKRYGYGSGLMSLVIGACLFAMTDLSVVRLITGTMTGGFSSGIIQESAMTYSGGDLSEKAKTATMVLLGIMQVVGFIAMFKGFLNLNAYYNDQRGVGLGTSFCWLIGGILCWNFLWFAHVLQNTLGVPIIKILTPFGGA